MGTIYMLCRNIKLRFNNLFTIFITITQPMIWLLLYSTVAKETMKNSGINNYTAFVLPGIIILVIFATSASSGMMNFIMINDRSLQRILISPIDRYSIVFGHVLESVLCSFLEISILIITSLILQVKLPIDFKNILLFVSIIFLSGLLMSFVSYSISLSLDNEMIYETVMNALILPLFFLSSALFPIDMIDGVIKVLININPFTHVINVLRSLILTIPIAQNYIFFVLLMLLILNIVMLLISISKLNKQTLS